MQLYGIYGASGCGRGIMPLAREMFATRDDVELVFIDDGVATLADSVVNGHRTLSWDEFMGAKADAKSLAIAIADSRIRERLAQRCSQAGVGIFTVKAGNVVIMDDVRIGEGALLSPFVTITSNIRIGKHFHANIYSYVEHDCIIGDYVTFAPSARCNGNIVIEDHAYIGSGAVIKQGRHGNPLIIGYGAIVGMGAVVTKNVPPGVTVVGCPARPLVKG